MSDTLSFPGEILREHRGDLYEVQITTGGATRIVLARRSGRLVQNFIRLIAGDKVTVEVSPYDTKRGRIVARERLNRTG